jgi:hypothetical protein
MFADWVGRLRTAGTYENLVRAGDPIHQSSFRTMYNPFFDQRKFCGWMTGYFGLIGNNVLKNFNLLK